MARLRAAVRALPFGLRLGLALACFALAGAAGTLFVLSPLRARVTVLEQRRAALEREIIQARGAAVELAGHRRDGARLLRQLERLTLQLPPEREIPPLYRRLYETAAATGLAVALFQPRDARIQDHYTEIPIALTAEGTFHQLGAFLARLGDLPRVVTVNALRMTAVERPSASMRADFTLSTYVYRPAATPAPAGPAVTIPLPTRVSSPPTAIAEPPMSGTTGYSARGRRDPFDRLSHSAMASTEVPPRRPLIASARLTGIVLGPDGPLALVETPDGLGYILRAGDGIEEARVIRIGRDSVVFAMPGTSGRSGEHIVLGLKMAQ